MMVVVPPLAKNDKRNEQVVRGQACGLCPERLSPEPVTHRIDQTERLKEGNTVQHPDPDQEADGIVEIKRLETVADQATRYKRDDKEDKVGKVVTRFLVHPFVERIR